MKPYYLTAERRQQPTCLGCNRDIAMVSSDVRPFLCPFCHEEMHETMATSLDKTYDKTKMNDWSACGDILTRYYGKWIILENGRWLNQFEYAALTAKEQS